MRNKILPLLGIIGFAALSFYSCDDKESGNGGDCKQNIWLGAIYTPTTTILEVVPQDRQMSFQGENIIGTIIDVFQPNITGNFEAVTEFDKFYFTGAIPGVAVPFIELYIKNYTQPDSIADPTSVYCRLTPYSFESIIGTDTVEHLFSAPLPTDYKGSLRVGRINGKLVSKAIMGTDTLNHVIPAILSTTTQQVGFRFGAKVTAGNVATAGIKLNKFNVISANNATNLLSDEFLCKSITFVTP